MTKISDADEIESANQEEPTNEVTTVSLMVKPLDEQQITGTKADMIKKAFLPMVNNLIEVEAEYQEILKMAIDENTVKKAKALRLKIVKIRTGVVSVHKEQKAEALRLGRAIDGIKNVYEFATSDKEAELEKIENHFENLEKERLDKVEDARLQLLAMFTDFNKQFYDIRNMAPDTFAALLKEQQDLKEFKEQKAKREAEEAESAQAKADLEEQRTAETIKLAEFIPNYENIFLSDLPEEEYTQLLEAAQTAKAEKDAEDARIKAENEALQKQLQEKEAAEKAAKKKADEDLKAIQDAAAAKLKAEQDKAAKEKAEAAAKLAAAEKKAAEEKAALQKQIDDKKLADEKAEKDKKAKEEKEADDRKKAEDKAKSDAEAAEKARLALGDKGKLEALTNELRELFNKYEFQSEEYKKRFTQLKNTTKVIIATPVEQKITITIS